jgi:hypothetical protein
MRFVLAAALTVDALCSRRCTHCRCALFSPLHSLLIRFVLAAALTADALGQGVLRTLPLCSPLHYTRGCSGYCTRCCAWLLMRARRLRLLLLFHSLLLCSLAAAHAAALGSPMGPFCARCRAWQATAIAVRPTNALPAASASRSRLLFRSRPLCLLADAHAAGLATAQAKALGRCSARCCSLL